MDVSVVIPVRNRPEALRAAVSSVFLQGLDVEVIIVDDASTDHTLQAAHVLAAADARISVIALDTNKGGGFARNVGIDAATKPWLAFLDSDDTWLPGKLSAQMQQLFANQPDAATCSTIGFTNLLVDHGDGRTPVPWNTLEFASQMSAKEYLLAHHQVIQTSTLFMPTAIARRVRFDDDLRRHQDIDFILRCEVAGISFIGLNQPLVLYSADPRSTRTSRRIDATPSLKWLQIATSYMTEKERADFYMRHVFDMEHQDAPWSARYRAWQAVRAGSISHSDFAIRCAKQMVPQAIKTMIRQRKSG